jgi:hypothetical protein
VYNKYLKNKQYLEEAEARRKRFVGEDYVSIVYNAVA